jgi:hypothetical protein
MNNTWPGGVRHAMDQGEHEKWNARNYPGTRELCATCQAPTGYCEEDGYTGENGERYCRDCAGRMWYCDTCGIYVENEHVTYEETHDTRAGGCGAHFEMPHNY